MANDQLISLDEPDLFLEYLLRCALTAPGVTASPTAGRILARLIVVGAIEGGDELITPYLVPMPGWDATFDVRTYRPGDLVPTDTREGLSASAALKIALRGARDSDDGIEVVSRMETGLERCVLVRDSTGDFEFRFPSSETLIGEPADCGAARSAWDAVLASWKGWTPADDAATGAWPTAPPPPAPAGTEAPATPAAEGDTGGLAGWWAPASIEDLTTEEASTRSVPTDPAVASRAQQQAPAPSSPAVAVGVPDESAAPAASAGSPPAQAPVEAAPLAGAPARAGASGAAEPLSDAIREAIANVVVEVDLGQVEQVLRRVLDDDRRQLVEPLARRLAARLTESLDVPDTDTVVEAVSRAVPRPGEVADAVAADIGALLSETILRRRPGDVVAAGNGNAVVGLEQLQVRLDGLQDQLQRSVALLQLLDDRLQSGDRRALVVERLSESVDQEMRRLAARIDDQVAALAANTAGGSELADGVARLTRKLRQSAAQLDRTLVRLDQIFDAAKGSAVTRLGLAAADPAPATPRSAAPGGRGHPVGHG
jgi:hypothetical protein